MLGFNNTIQRLKQHIQLLTFCAALSILTGAVAHFQITIAFDRFVFDWAQRFSPLTIDDDIVIIEIDDKSIAELGRWPWSRAMHAELIDTLRKENANTIAFDILFADSDTANPQADDAFTHAIQQHGNVVLPLHIEKLGTQGQMLEVLPAKTFLKAAAGLGHVHVAQDSDGVTRSVFLKEGVGNAFWPHFSVTINQHFAQAPPNMLPGEKNTQQNALPSPNTIERDYLNYIPVNGHAPKLTYFSYADVLANNTAKNAFNNKLVFIGATATGLGDVLTTSVGPMQGVELNAWIYEALRQNKLIQHAGPSYSLTLNLLASFFILIVLGRLGPKALLLASLASAIALLGFSILLQNYFSFWLPLSPVLLALCIFYPLWSWLRLEIAIKFLKQELNQLNEHPHQLQFEVKQAEKGLNYLQDLGILSRWDSTKRSTDSKSNNDSASESNGSMFLLKTDTTVIRAYLSKQYLQKIPRDWDMAKRAEALFNRFYKSTNPQSLSGGTGTEVISQTVAQLSAVKQGEEISQRLLQQSLAKLQDGVIIANMYGTVLFANDAFASMAGKTIDNSTNLMDAIGQLSLKDNSQWRPLIASLYADRKSISGQAANTATNVDLFFQARTENIYGDFEDTIIITFTNITEVRAAEKAKMEALNFLSHDLRAPMLSVLAVIERHKSNCAESNYAEHQAFSTIETLVRQNLSYAEDFLQLSRAQTLKESQFHFCDLHAIFDGAHKNALALARGKNVAIHTQKADVDAWVMGDHSLLERTLTNIITNAIKYSPKNSQIQLALKPVDNHFEIDVIDKGIGINDKDLNTIFDRFSRGKQGNKEHGAGLGLYFAALVAKQHGGDIIVESEIGKGSVFKLVLPAVVE